MTDERALPDFLIVGAQKSGTTSLFAYLAGHPRILPARRKEVHFFDLAWSRGIEWYRSFFPLISDLAPDLLTGEATPYLLFHPLCPGRVRSVVPDARLIVVLRDPTARALSHYRHERRLGHENQPLNVALQLERERLADRDDWFAHQHFSYVARGEYVIQLRRWFESFPREQFVILPAEEMFSDPAGATNRVLAHLGLGPTERDSWPVFLPDGSRAGTPPGPAPDDRVDAAVEARLRAYFRPFNDELAALLGRELPWD